MTEPRTRPMSASELSLLSRPANVLRSSSGWDELPASTGVVGGSAWVQAWVDTFGSGHTLGVRVIGLVEQPRAVLPLVRSRRTPWVWEMLGVRQLGEPMDVRGDDEAAVGALVESVQRQHLPLRLRRLPADSPLLPHLLGLRNRQTVVRQQPVASTPTIPLDNRWREPEHRFSSRRRADFRTARRRADALGQVEFLIEEPTPEMVAPLFDELVAVEASGWKTRAGTALAVQPQMRKFFLRFCTLAAEQKALRLAFLRIDGRPVAVQLAVEQESRYSLFKIGFDKDFARCSPGNLLMLHAVRQAADRGLRSFEFLGAEEHWTALWTDEVRRCVDVSVYLPSPWSPLAAGEDVARRAAKWGVQKYGTRRVGG
jgi:CelD/BcsL family acetyltransferase involved in cellulose biosynthesis